MEKYQHIYEILNLTEKQKVEFEENMKEVEVPPTVIKSLHLETELCRCECGLRLLSEPVTRYLIIRFSYPLPTHELSVDEFKEMNKKDYFKYRQENLN